MIRVVRPYLEILRGVVVGLTAEIRESNPKGHGELQPTGTRNAALLTLNLTNMPTAPEPSCCHTECV